MVWSARSVNTDDYWIGYESTVGYVTVKWETVNGISAWYLRNNSETILVFLRGVQDGGPPLSIADAILAVLRSNRDSWSVASVIKK